jgi:hypothetical protein
MITIPWIIAGIFSCLLFTFSERYWIRNIELAGAMVLLLIYAFFVFMGPAGLAMLLIAQLIVFLANL